MVRIGSSWDRDAITHGADGSVGIDGAPFVQEVDSNFYLQMDCGSVNEDGGVDVSLDVEGVSEMPRCICTMSKSGLTFRRNTCFFNSLSKVEHSVLALASSGSTCLNIVLRIYPRCLSLSKTTSS